jgi:hypothetical protein
MRDTLDHVKTHYESRIVALLERWRCACVDRGWLTGELRDGPRHTIPCRR